MAKCNSIDSKALAKKIVSRITKDIDDRQDTGFDKIEEDLRAEIIGEWEAMTRRILSRNKK